MIARLGDVVLHAVDPDELALCRRLAAEIAAVMTGVEIGMGSESGDEHALRKVPEQDWPVGTEMTGSVLPRLALGLTRGGSLVGLFGYVVQT